MKPDYRLLLLGLFLLALVGCAGMEQREEPADEGATEDEVGEVEEDDAEDDDADAADQAEEEDAGAQVITGEQCPPDCPFDRDAIEDSDSLLAERTVYFEFDSSDVDDEYRDMLRRHAEYLTRYDDVEVRLEGHTDERGSREYNLGLGERRADAVRDVLRAYGVSRDQLETVSYGEEVPAVDESNEEAWAENRRVEIRY